MLFRALARIAAVAGATTGFATAGWSVPVHVKSVDSAKAQDAKKAGAPAYKSVWKMSLPAGTVRVAVADVTEDKKHRLLVLDGKGTLTINRLANAKDIIVLENDGEIALGKDAAKFAVGHFVKGKPAMIAAPGGIYYRDGGKFSKKPTTDLDNLSGAVRFTDGTECLFTLDQVVNGGPPVSFAVDPTAEKPLSPGKEMPEPEQTSGVYGEITVQLPPQMLEGSKFPDEMKQGGVVRLQDIRNDKNLYAVIAWQAADGSYLVVLEGSDVFPQGNPSAKPVWKSPNLAGKMLDIALGPNPRDPKQTGIFALYANDAGDKKPVLEFFTLN